MYPIADMFSAIRNATMIRKQEVVIPSSKFKLAILKILKKESYISDYNLKKTKNKSLIHILLNYQNNKSKITKIRCISKPGKKAYTSYQRIPRPLQGMGVAVISTSQGVMDGKEAWRRRLGGEVICEVY